MYARSQPILANRADTVRQRTSFGATRGRSADAVSFASLKNASPSLKKIWHHTQAREPQAPLGFRSPMDEPCGSLVDFTPQTSKHEIKIGNDKKLTLLKTSTNNEALKNNQTKNNMKNNDHSLPSNSLPYPHTNACVTQCVYDPSVHGYTAVSERDYYRKGTLRSVHDEFNVQYIGPAEAFQDGDPADARVGFSDVNWYQISWGDVDAETGAISNLTYGTKIDNKNQVWERGHILGKALGGRGVGYNLFNQDGGQNRSAPWTTDEASAKNRAKDLAKHNGWFYYEFIATPE